ncbi:MAG: hypothetical protein AAGA33_03480 [Pseudomonadota bacterium]
MRCVYITMDDMGDYVSDADLSLEPMQALGWQVDKISWRADVDWGDYDLAYVCTPWDYHKHLDDFLAVIDTIDRSDVVLANPGAIIRWNADKRYLKVLDQKGAAIVPSLWFDTFAPDCLSTAFAQFATNKIVIKPVVGASALDTYVLAGMPDNGLLDELARAYRDRPFFLQPFLQTVADTGEYSLMYVDGEFSHAILKVPKPGDFRTQEEHGSDIQPYLASPEMVAQGQALVDSLDPPVAYARVDYVHGDDGGLWLMELELIEPSLYFRTNEGSAVRFARAMTRYYERQES